jgi:hypothetical protein
MYALHNFGWKPSEYIGLPLKEKAAIMAMIDYKVEAEAKERAKLKR